MSFLVPFGCWLGASGSLLNWMRWYFAKEGDGQ